MLALSSLSLVEGEVAGNPDWEFHFLGICLEDLTLATCWVTQTVSNSASQCTTAFSVFVAALLLFPGSDRQRAHLVINDFSFCWESGTSCRVYKLVAFPVRIITQRFVIRGNGGHGAGAAIFLMVPSSHSKSVTRV